MNNEPFRKPIQDITVPHHELVRRQVTSTNHSATMTDLHSKESPKPPVRRIENNPFFNKNPKDKKKKQGHGLPFWLWGVGFALLALGIFTLATYFSSAEVEVTVVTKNVEVKEEFVATSEPNPDGLEFQFMSFVEEKTKEVPATVEKKIQKKASGTILVYNAYSSASQRLIKNTRFESSIDHKIFRIDESVVVPGARVSTKPGEKGKILEPGVVEVVVYADVPGKDYNIGLSDFTIPGFKGDPRYARFTARSKPGSPLQGGFSGTVKIASDASLVAAQSELKEQLKKIAIEKVRAQIPNNTSFFPGSVIMKFEEIPQAFGSEATTKVSLRAIISVFFFDTDILTKEIIKKVAPDHSTPAFSLADMSSLSFKFIDPVEGIVLSDLSRIRFSLAGQAVLVGNVNIEKLKNLIAGKTRQESFEIIKSQNNVKKINFIIRPFWQKVLPVDPSKISIKIVTP